MNKEETRKAIEVMQAWIDGEEIEWYSSVSGWTRVNTVPLWEWYEHKYRIKPKPRSIWVNEYEGQISSNVFFAKESADRAASQRRTSCVEFREVSDGL